MSATLELRGIGVSEGIALGPALLVEREVTPVLRLLLPEDAVVIDEKDAEGVYDFSSREFSEFYQSAADTAETIFEKRHRTRSAKAAE